MKVLTITLISLIAGAVIGGVVMFGAQSLVKSESDHFVKVHTQGPEATVSASKCHDNVCDITVKVKEWNAVDVLAVEDTEADKTVILTPENDSVTFENVSQQYATKNGGQGAVRTYLPIESRQGTGYEGEEYHRIPNLKEESKSIHPTAIGVYCSSKSKITVDGVWKASEVTC